jgi:D-glycero-alpha-D-manno-heptose-7-phosphate kinase
VISATIDAFMYVTIKDMFDTNVRVHHSTIETESIASRISHPYVRTALEHFGLFRGVEVIVVSDVMTTGSGLGASSALMSALVLAASHLRSRPVAEPEHLAKVTVTLERQAGTIGGCQDQYAASFGGLNAISFTGQDVSVAPLRVHPSLAAELEDRLLLVFTNLARNSHPIQSHVAATLQNAEKDSYLNEMYQSVQEFEAELLSPSADISRLGRILHQTWELKKHISPLSTNLYVDELYDFMRGNGVVGGKVTGAGGGGFFLAITESAEAKKALMYKLYPNYISMDMRLHPTGTELLWKNF